MTLRVPNFSVEALSPRNLMLGQQGTTENVFDRLYQEIVGQGLQRMMAKHQGQSVPGTPAGSAPTPDQTTQDAQLDPILRALLGDIG